MIDPDPPPVDVGQHGPNVIEVNGTAMLLPTTSGGVAVHLTTVTDQPGAGLAGSAGSSHPAYATG